MQRTDNFSGEQYEIEFIRSMIRHHWSAIREADTCMDRAEHGELLTLCQNIRQTQLQEIRQMKSWLEQWYGKHGGRSAETG